MLNLQACQWINEYLSVTQSHAYIGMKVTTAVDWLMWDVEGHSVNMNNWDENVALL